MRLGIGDSIKDDRVSGQWMRSTNKVGGVFFYFHILRPNQDRF
jgi:hypothetical protein